MSKQLRVRKSGRYILAIVLALLLAIASPVALTRPALADNGDNYPYKTDSTWNSGCDADPWGECKRYCTSWTAWALQDRNGFVLSSANGLYDLGNANLWKSGAVNAPGHYAVNNTPAVGAVAWYDAHSWNGGYGHVAWVSAINSSTSIVVEQYNWNLDGTYTPSPSTVTHTSSQPWPDGFIHFNDIPTKIIGAWDGGTKTLPAVFRPSNGTWYYYTSTGTVSQQFGLSGDIPTPGWYSGGAKLDYAVFRPSNSTWYRLPQGGSSSSQAFGSSGDIPVPGDYGGEGHTEYAVFRPSNSTWYWLTSSGTVSQAFGQSGDIPVPAVWDGGGSTEPGVFRPSTGTWIYLTPSGSVSQSFGLSGDIPEPAYYSGGSKPDYGVFRPSNSTWYKMPQGGSSSSQAFGSSGDTPVPGNYSGAVKTDYGVFRPSNTTWYWLPQGGSSNSQAFGSSGDIPAVLTLPYPILHSLGLL
jgi:surface antigen